MYRYKKGWSQQSVWAGREAGTRGKMKCVVSAAGERKAIVRAVIPGCHCCLGNVCQHHAEAQAAAAAGRRRRCLSLSLLCLMLASQRCLCHKQECSQGVVVCIAFSTPVQTTTTTTKPHLCYVAVRLVAGRVLGFFFSFFAAVWFQDDLRVYSLDLRGVVRRGIPLLPQTQQFAISWADPAERITSGQKHFVAGAQQPIPFAGMVSSTACC